MNEEEKEDIELDIEAKYVDKTEKEFLSRVTYAECLYVLTPENKYCDKIKELSVLKICEIIEKLQKENERLKKQVEYDKTHIYTPQTIKLNYILIQKVKDEIEKEIKYHEKNILDIENKIMLKNKTAKEEAEIEFNKYAIVVLKKMLQELLEGRK